MNFNLPMKDEAEYEAEMLQKLTEMVEARKAGQIPAEPAMDTESDDVSSQIAALRKVVGEPEAEMPGLGEQPTEDMVDPSVMDEMPGEPVMDEDNAAKLAALQKYLQNQR